MTVVGYDFGKQFISAKVKIMRRKVLSGCAANCRLFCRGKANLKLIGDRLRDSSLNSKNIRQVAIEMFGPKMGIVSGIDELRRDTHGVAGALDAAFQNVGDAKCLP